MNRWLNAGASWIHDFILGIIFSSPSLRRFVFRRLTESEYYERALDELLYSDFGSRAQYRIIGGSWKVGLLNLITREEWLERTLHGLPKGAKILDAGAGELKYKPLCEHLNYVSQDFGQYDGVGDGKGLQTSSWDNSRLDIVSDIASIPVPDATFDAIMCIEVFEHLPHPIEAIREFSRIIKPGGTLIITAPFCSLTHFAPFYFYNGFSKYWYERMLTDFGFEIEEIVPLGNYFQYVAQELRRLSNVAETYASDTFNSRERLARDTLLSMLERFSARDNGSSELLNHGYNVRAVKKP